VERLREWWGRRGGTMARTCVIIAQLDPEDAFEDRVETVEADFGVVQIAQNRLKLAFRLENEDKDVNFEAIFKDANFYLKAVLSTLAWVTGIGAGYKIFDYVEFADERLVLVGLVSPQQPQPKVESGALSSTQELLPLVTKDSHLRWALEDYHTALRECGHELIFLYRCIEWLKVRFGSWEEAWGTIKSTQRRIKAIKRDANEYYFARHAVKGRHPVPRQVLEDAFKNTRLILQKYMEWLSSQPLNRT